MSMRESITIGMATLACWKVLFLIYFRQVELWATLSWTEYISSLQFPGTEEDFEPKKLKHSSYLSS